MVRAAAIALAALLIAVAPAQARIEIPAKVRYATSRGPSEWHSMQVQFVTGGELNRATRSIDYDALGHYALIWFGEGQVAIIKIQETLFGCSREFSVECLPRIGNMNGPDQQGRLWEICTGRLCL